MVVETRTSPGSAAPRMRAAAWTADASHLVALEFDLTDVDPGASGEAVGAGGVEHGRGPTHRTGGAIK